MSKHKTPIWPIVVGAVAIALWLIGGLLDTSTLQGSIDEFVKAAQDFVG